MSKVINIPRYAAQDFNRAIEKFCLSFDPPNTIWVSIGEPDVADSMISSEVLDEIPNLKLAFWDLSQVINHDGENLYPPNESDAKKIVDFILLHRGKEVIVNCAAGVSRSGAVAQFCEDFLDYEWSNFGKRNSCPNHVLYNLMRDYFLSLEFEEKFGPKPLLSAYEKIIDKQSKS